MYRHRAKKNDGDFSVGSFTEIKNNMGTLCVRMLLSRCNLRIATVSIITLAVLLFVWNVHELSNTLKLQQVELRTGLVELRQLSATLQAIPHQSHQPPEAGNDVDLSFKRFVQNKRRRPTLWLLAKSVSHLNHVINVFERVGYHIIREPSTHWDVMWAYDYPFSGRWRENILNMKGHQKVNHFPGSGFITNKQSLSSSQLAHLPRAYRIPEDVEKLKQYANSHPNTMWVMKSNDHRGIHIKRIDEMNLSPSGSLHFVQEFVQRPLLVDGRKFDIGVYVVITSVNPLRVYVYEDEVLLRFCARDYHPLDVDDVRKYVVLDEYTGMSELPSMKEYIAHQHFSAKQSLNLFMRKKGIDDEKVWKEIQQSIEDVMRAKEADIKNTMSKYPWPSGFFELVRFDFVIDEMINVWLMEVNMSPNLSSASHAANALMYEQVVYNTLALVGLARWTAGTTEHMLRDESEMRASEQDIGSVFEECLTSECDRCGHVVCSLCRQCRSDVQTRQLKAAFLEHVNRGNFRRVFPRPLGKRPSSVLSSSDNSLSAPNKVMSMWFRAKCIHDVTWCS